MAFRCAVKTLLDPLSGMAVLRMDEYRLGPDEPPLVDFSPFAGLTVPNESVSGSDTAAVERQRQAPITPAGSYVAKETPKSDAQNRHDRAKTVPVFSMRKPESKQEAVITPQTPRSSESPFPQVTTQPESAPEPNVTRQINVFVEQLLSSQTESGQGTPYPLASEVARLNARASALSEIPRPGVSQIKPLKADRSLPGSAIPSGGAPIAAGQDTGSNRAGYSPHTVETSRVASTHLAEKTILLIERLADVVLAGTSSSSAHTPSQQPTVRSISRREAAASPEFPPANGNGKRPEEQEFVQMMREPFRSEWPTASAHDSSTADAPSISANHDAPARPDMLAFADTPEKIVDLVTDALAEQARRHGVDLI